MADELEQLLQNQGYSIRKEKGNFMGDSCLIEGDKLIMINKMQPIEIQLGVYARVLKDCDLENDYLKPATWKYLKSFWQKLDKTEE
jgi:hypothetical protein